MRISYQELKRIIKKLDWTPKKLASKLSIIGHEADVLDTDHINVKLTSNRADCRDIKYLAFDLAGVYEELGTNKHLVSFKPGKTIKITLKKINIILGSNISNNKYKKLEKLGFAVTNDAVIPPDFRKDIIEGADIAEEVFRIIGSSALKIKMPSKQTTVKPGQFEFLNNLRATLSEVGASETRTISFTRRGNVKLKNPFSVKQPFMRATLLYGLLETIAKNPYLRRSYFYEIGNVFKPKEIVNLGVILTGYKNPGEMIKKLEKELGINILFSPVDKELLNQFSVKQPNVIFAEINVDNVKLSSNIVYKSSGMPIYKKIGKFPPLVRDITLSQDIEIKSLKNVFDNLLIVELIDKYTNPNTDKISSTYRLIFQNTKESFSQEQISEIDGKLSSFI